jgi:hypothetical protein
MTRQRATTRAFDDAPVTAIAPFELDTFWYRRATRSSSALEQ